MVVLPSAELTKVQRAAADLAQSKSEADVESLGDHLDRFVRLPADESGFRITVPKEASIHLGTTIGDIVYLWRFPGRLEIWSKDYRNQRHISALASLDDAS